MRQVFVRATPSVVLLLSFLFAACTQEPQEKNAAVTSAADIPIAETCTLTMGWDPWEPYQFRDADGNITGLDIDIARAAAESAGCEIRFMDGKWMDMMKRLRDGDVDLLAGATPTAGRKEFAVFTAPYRSESFVAFTLADNASIRAAKTLAELFESEARIGIVAEYYYGAQVLEMLDAAVADDRVSEATVSELNYKRLLNGEIDVFLDDPFVASSILQSRGWGERIVSTGLNTATGEIAFMISRQSVSPENVARFEDGLRQIRENGQLEAITAGYRN